MSHGPLPPGASCRSWDCRICGQPKPSDEQKTLTELGALRSRLRQFVEMLDGGATDEVYPGDDAIMQRLAGHVERMREALAPMVRRADEADRALIADDAARAALGGEGEERGR